MISESKKPAAILLAAGMSRRFGENKLFHPIGGKPMYRHMADRLAELLRRGEIADLVVVTGYDRIRDEIGNEANVVMNRNPELGITHSLALGLTRLLSSACPDACLFAVADEPFFTLESLEALLTAYERSDKGIAAPAPREEAGTGSVDPGTPLSRLGNPVIFSAAYFPELLSLSGDRGGKRVALRHPEDILICPVPEAELRDLDTRGSLTAKGGDSLPEASPVRFFAPANPVKYLSFAEAFPFLAEESGVISIVGAGGKTTLLYALAGFLEKKGRRALVTTTTHIAKPDDFVMARGKEDLLQKWGKKRAVLYAADDPRAPDRKLCCPDIETLDNMIELADFTLIEADGAKRLAAKIPNRTEPVILPETTTVIGVLGLSAIGRPCRDVCFRVSGADRRFGIGNPAQPFTAEIAAAILASDEGTRKGTKNRPYYVVLNQCDDQIRLGYAAAIAENLRADVAEGRITGVVCSHFTAFS